METNKSAWVVWLLILAAIVIVIALSVRYFSGETYEPLSIQNNEPVGIDNVIRTILVQHSYDDATGSHTYTGLIAVPTPCHDISHTVTIMESFPEQVRIDFFTVAPPADVACAQVITEKSFTVTFKASENSVGERVSATLDGAPIYLLVGGKD